MVKEPSSRTAGVDVDAPGMADRAENALTIAVVQLEDDFRHILVNNIVPFDATIPRGISTSLVPHSAQCFETSTVPPLERVNSEVKEDISPVRLELNGELDLDLLHPAAIYKLKEIADRMIRSGYEKECCLVYSSVRCHVLDECLSILGIEKYSIEVVQRMEWTALYDQMGKWIHALKFLGKRLLSGEKFLCEQVFAGSESMREVCFVESAKGCVMEMLNFGKAVATCRRSSNKLFRILDMYNALSDVMPDLEELFDGDSGAGEMVCGEAKGVLEGFCVTSFRTYVEFERAVREDIPAWRMPEDGDIHQLTRYVMNYLKLLVDYSEILNGILERFYYISEQLQNNEEENVERMPSITRRLLSLIKGLESNLEGLSRMYDDGGLQYVFLMNNVLHILNKLKDPEFRNMLGDQCISKRRDQIRQYALTYLRSSWTEALNILHVERLIQSKDLIVLRLGTFNAYFAEAHRIQRAWKVADPRLRKDLHIMISEKLIQKYRSFLGRFGSYIINSKYIKYTPEDLDSFLLDFFEGYTIQRRKSCIC